MYDLLKYPLMPSLIVRSLRVSISSSFLFIAFVHTLLGESLPLPGTVDSTDDNYLETKCIGLQGTHCISGSGIGVVVSTGDSTVFGKIAKLTNTPKTGLTLLEREILNFVILIFTIMTTIIIVVIIVW